MSYEDDFFNDGGDPDYFEEEEFYSDYGDDDLDDDRFGEFADDMIRKAIEGDIILTEQEIEELKEEYEYEDEDTETA